MFLFNALGFVLFPPTSLTSRCPPLLPLFFILFLCLPQTLSHKACATPAHSAPYRLPCVTSRFGGPVPSSVSPLPV